MNKDTFIEEKKQEFRKMRNLTGLRQIWKIHPIGVGIDIDEWFDKAIQEAIKYGEEK